MLGSGRRGLGKPFELTRCLFERLFGHSSRFDFGAQSFDFFLVVFTLTEFPADRLELLPQHVFALRLSDLILDFLLDLGLDLQRFRLF